MRRMKHAKAKVLNVLPPRARKWLVRGGVAFVCYLLAGFFLLPPILKWQMKKQLPEITKRQVAVRQVKFNPLNFSLAVRGLALNEPDGKPFVSWEEFYVNFQASSLFRWTWTFAEIRLVDPFGEIILHKDGRLNFANMAATSTNAAPKDEPARIPRVRIARLEVTNGFVAFEDQTRRSVFRTEYRPINLHLTRFATRLNADSPYSFHASSDAGRSITWSGDLTIQPLRSSGDLEITGVKLGRYQPYLEEFTRAHLTNGLADLQFTYHLAAGANSFDLVITNGAAQFTEVQVIDPATGETVSALRGLEVSRADFNLRERSVHLGEIKASEATVLTRLGKDGRLNLLDLMTPRAVIDPVTNTSPVVVDAPAPAPWTVAVDDFTIERTAVSFEDLARRTPFKTELKPIEVNVKQFTTKADSDASYSFHIASEAAETLEGAGTVSVNPVRSTGEIKIGAVDVKKYWPYMEGFFRGRIISGQIEARAPYLFALTTNQVMGGVTNLALRLSNLEVQMPESPETVTRIAEIAFEGVDASLEERRARVALFKGTGGSLLLRRQKDGALNLLGLLAASRTNAPSAPRRDGEVPISTNRPATTEALALGGWTLNLDELQLNDYALKIEDLVPDKAATFVLDQLALNMKGASTVTNTPIHVSASVRVNEAGTVALQGVTKIAPLFAEFDVAVTNLDLRAAQPYLDPVVALNVTSGKLATMGKLRFQTNDASAPRLTFTGGLGVTDLATTDQVLTKEFVRWDDLAVSGIEAAIAPNRLKIGEVRLVQPKVGLIVRADKQSNLSLILKKAPASTNITAVGAPGAGTASTSSTASTASTASNAPASFPFAIDTVRLERASFAFTDESVQPPVALGIEELNGTIQELSSTKSSPAIVDLHGRVDAQSPFAATGRVNPFPGAMFVELTITNANTQLTPLTGYVEKYGGYPLVKGRLNTSLRYSLEKQVLKAENKIQVDQLTLGARNNSPDATQLPVKLGVALLKDNNGRIDLDVPVSGKLDDPEFKLGAVIWKVVGNIIVKAAASPFKLLGSLVGVGGEELSFVEFTPGTTNVIEGELDKLGKLTAALGKRPALNLEIEGAVHPVADRRALSRLKLREQLDARSREERATKNQTTGSVDTVQVEPAERDRLLRTAFIEEFGTNISAIIQTNLARLIATNQVADAPAPKPKGSLLQRAWGLVSGPFQGGPKAERQLSKADREALGMATPELMEELLAEKVTVTDEELRQLMTARARRVMDSLAQDGQVSGDRLLLSEPKPLSPTYKGGSRVSLSLN